MTLWLPWWNFVLCLRPAFSRYRAFLWFSAALAAFCVRDDLRGVTSFVRALGLRQRFYDRLLDFFHSPAVDVPKLTLIWTGLVLGVLKHPRRYGLKRHLKNLFEDAAAFTEAASPVYGEKGVTLRYRSVDLCWHPVGCLVRFVAVIHPHRGQKIFLSTDLTLDPLTFKQAVHTVGVYSYHFWMAAMTPRSRRSGNPYLHRKSEYYRKQVRRNIAAYHCHLQAGIIAQGLLQMLSVLHPETVWGLFGSWIRTIRPGIPPSEQVVALALCHALPQFLVGGEKSSALAIFINERLDLDRAEGLRLAA